MGSATAGQEPEGTIRELVLSGLRLSAGVTLYGIEQVQKVVEAATGERGLPGAAATAVSAMDGLTGFLEGAMNATKREALRSFSRVSAKAIEKTFDAISPSAIMEARNRLMGRRETESSPAQPGGASLAVDVLSGGADT